MNPFKAVLEPQLWPLPELAGQAVLAEFAAGVQEVTGLPARWEWCWPAERLLSLGRRTVFLRVYGRDWPLRLDFSPPDLVECGSDAALVTALTDFLREPATGQQLRFLLNRDV